MTEPDQKTLNDPNILADEINLRELFNVIWEGKKLIIVLTTFLAICSIVYSLMLPNYYSSESILVPRDSNNSNSLSQYSGLASLAGISLPNSSNSSVFEVMQTIQSREFVKHLVTFEDVLPSIMAAQSYDPTSQELYLDPDIYDVKTKTWTRKISKNKGVEPSYLEAHKEYLEMLSISQDKQTKLISMKIEHISPIFAKDLLDLIIRETNHLHRTIDIESSNKALSYLKTELSQTLLVEIKESINQLIKAQLETRMMASIHEDYSLILLEPPFIPEDKSRPGRALIVILVTMLGGMLSLIIVLFRHYTLGKGKKD